MIAACPCRDNDWWCGWEPETQHQWKQWWESPAAKRQPQPEGNMDFKIENNTVYMPIDWSKPIRTVPNGNRASSVLVGGARIVTWNGLSAAVVDDCGRQVSVVSYEGLPYPAGYKVVENVPEEPKDHVILWACRDDNDWELHNDPGDLYTKEQADKILANKRTISGGMRYVAVKVPVL